MKIYISGQITGLESLEVKKKFAKAEMLMKKKGHQPINPLTLKKNQELKSDNWEKIMLNDIAELFKCEAIYMLKDWWNSKGAKIEYHIARTINLKIIFED